MVALLSWFSLSEDSNVNTLRVNDIAVEELAPTRDYLRTLDVSLKNVRIHCEASYEASNENLCDYTDFSHNTSLLSVVFGTMRLNIGAFGALYRCLPTFISRITSHAIETIMIEFLADYMEYLHPLDWNHLTQILAREQFSGLQRLKFRVTIRIAEFDEATRCSRTVACPSRHHPLCV